MSQYCTIIALLITRHAVAADVPLIPFGSTWKYLDNGSNQGTAWRANVFNDAAWPAGPAELGYGDGDEATVVSFGPNANAKYVTTYFRKTITIADPTAFAGYAMRIHRDDGVIVYVNGTEVLRQNFSQGTISSSALAYQAVSTSEEDQLLQLLLTPAQFTSGSNTIAVEVHQNAANSSDLSFDLELLGLDATPELHRGPYLHIATPSSITICWTSNVPTDGRVRYGTAPDALTMSFVKPQNTLHHEVTLTGLQPGTRYFYAIGSSSHDITSGTTDTFFDTHPPQGTESAQRIWVIGDAGTGYASQKSVRDSYVNFINSSRKADAWLMLGDNAYGHGRESEYQPDSSTTCTSPSCATPPCGLHPAITTTEAVPMPPRTRAPTTNSSLCRGMDKPAGSLPTRKPITPSTSATSTSSRWTAMEYPEPLPVPWPLGCKQTFNTRKPTLSGSSPIGTTRPTPKDHITPMT